MRMKQMSLHSKVGHECGARAAYVNQITDPICVAAGGSR